jgi:hypothetical protein
MNHCNKGRMSFVQRAVKIVDETMSDLFGYFSMMTAKIFRCLKPLLQRSNQRPLKHKFLNASSIL